MSTAQINGPQRSYLGQRPGRAELADRCAVVTELREQAVQVFSEGASKSWWRLRLCRLDQCRYRVHDVKERLPDPVVVAPAKLAEYELAPSSTQIVALEIASAIAGLHAAARRSLISPKNGSDLSDAWANR
ncbi:Uncharacterised protein [Mycobacteroides abscessus subsp. bolletii]|nr:Uncharacterised protein [Mycobacteroides abscessus subsp. bolletii]